MMRHAAIDPDPRPADDRPQRLILAPRPRVSNERWDAARMLSAASARAYPSAEGAGRESEQAYWTWRAALSAAGADAATHPEDVP